MLIKELWVGTRNKRENWAGTLDDVSLIVNEEGIDVLWAKIPFDAGVREDGVSAVGHLEDVETAIDIRKMDDSSIRVTSHGENQWAPEEIAVWGDADDGGTDLVGYARPAHKVSRNPDEGRVSLPIAKLVRGKRNASRISALLMVVTSEPDAAAGTRLPVQLAIKRNGPENVLDSGKVEVRNRTRALLSWAAAETINGFDPFPLRDYLEGKVSLWLRNEERDAWSIRSVTIFGLDRLVGARESSTLVHQTFSPPKTLSYSGSTEIELERYELDPTP